MSQNRNPASLRQRNNMLVLILMCVAVGLAAWASLGETGLWVMGGLIGAVMFVLAFTRPQMALYLIMILVVWSPEFGGGGPRAAHGGTRGVTIRGEDVLLMFLILGWAARSFVNNSHPILHTPLNGRIVAYIVVAFVSTMLGVVRGNVDLKMGFFFTLKFLQYFLFFFMVVASVKSKKQARQLMNVSLFVFFTAVLFGYSQLGVGRIYAPFDAGEPNTFGGYMVMMMCLCAGIASTTKNRNLKGVLYGLPIFALVPFLYTKSRASYVAIFASYLAFTFCAKQKGVFLLAGVALAALFMGGYVGLPDEIQQRIGGTFEGNEHAWNARVEIFGIEFDASASERLISYIDALKLWMQEPFFGKGVTGTHFIDGQYFRMLAETGLMGFITFMSIFVVLCRTLLKIYRKERDDYFKGAALGMFCATIGMLAHCLTANTFVIIRIAEPFWLLTGLIMLLPRFEEWDEITFDHAEFIALARNVPKTRPIGEAKIVNHPSTEN